MKWKVRFGTTSGKKFWTFTTPKKADFPSLLKRAATIAYGRDVVVEHIHHSPWHNRAPYFRGTARIDGEMMEYSIIDASLVTPQWEV